MKKYIKYFPIFLLLLLAFFLRIYRAKLLYNYNHDNDLASWIIKDILVNHHLRLIGQQTSVLGVFIGGLFYYLQIPFYLIGKMNPFYTVYLTAILGTFSVFSFYFVFSKIFGKKTGFIAAFIYCVSKIIVFSDRGVYPTMPVMLWTIWYIYDLYLIYKGKQKSGFILFGILFALIWHMNIALYIVTPIALSSLIYSKKRIEWKSLFIGCIVLVVFCFPLIMFEVRHNFQQSQAVFASLTTSKNLIPGTATGFGKFDRVIQLVSTNTRNIFLPEISGISTRLAFYILVTIFVYLAISKKISGKTVAFFLIWQLLYILFFTLNSLNVSEYYLDGMNVIWIAIVSIFFAKVYENKILKYPVIVLAVIYLIWNVYLIINTKPLTEGYVYRKELVDYIKEDSLRSGYSCVSISYITKPGYDLGYRYLFYLNNMHVNHPDSGSPVYTIVFPLSMVNSFDKRFGDLGLIYPNYSKYNKTDVDRSCSGENSNITDPMFGYTE